MNKKIIKYIIIITLLVLLLTLNFISGFLGYGRLPFKTFQSDSEYLVLSKILQDKYNLDSKYGLSIIGTNVDENENVERIENLSEYYNVQNDNIITKDYTSQFGLQGYIFSFLYNKFHVPYGFLKLICCVLLALIIVAICYLISRKYNILMGGIFYITFLLSPWIVAFARNLYWVEFTWFLPVLFSLLISMKYLHKKILIPCIFLSIFIKCLCGYEYITTIMLMTISFFIVDFFITKDSSKRKEILKTTLITGMSCLLAFFIALCIHAVLRGNGNVIQGLKDIYIYDVKRRTIITGSTDLFDSSYTPSLEASVWEVVNKYFSWSSNIIIGIQGKFFLLIFIFTLIIIAFNLIKREKYAYRDLIMFIIFLLTTLSWFILGKSHSYVHTHMNYVLWYFGFIQICLYIIINFIITQIEEFSNTNN